MLFAVYILEVVAYILPWRYVDIVSVLRDEILRTSIYRL